MNGNEYIEWSGMDLSKENEWKKKKEKRMEWN